MKNKLVMAALIAGLAFTPVQAAEKVKVGVSKMAALTNAWVAKQAGIFEKNGLDVDLVEFRNGNEAISAHRSGAVDFVLSIPGTAMMAAERGFDLVLLTQNETAKTKGPDAGALLVLSDSPFQAGVARNLSWIYVESVPEQPIGAWFASSTFIAKKKDVAMAFVKSIQEAIDYMHADEVRARQNVAAFTGLDPKLTQTMPLNNWDWRISPARWQETIDMMVKSGELTKPHKAEEYFSEVARQFVVK